MNKGPDAFRTISEVAEDLDVPQHVLRFWETRFATIRPLKRGGGRRYYRPDDVDLLKGIRQLLYGQGYTIRGVQRILKEDGLRFVQGVGRGEQWAAPAGPEAAGFDEPDGEGTLDAVAEPRTGFVSSSGWDGDAPASAPAAASDPVAQPVSSGPTADRLRQALDDLIECRRALDSLSRS